MARSSLSPLPDANRKPRVPHAQVEVAASTADVWPYRAMSPPVRPSLIGFAAPLPGISVVVLVLHAARIPV